MSKSTYRVGLLVIALGSLVMMALNVTHMVAPVYGGLCLGALALWMAFYGRARRRAERQR